VATPARNGVAASIDLSWEPVAEPDVAGYFVYRRENADAWQRISPAAPVVGPGFHDALIESGHKYRYAVSAVDQGGHESARSAEIEETAPGQ
jgi:fibronectin type 3 domain-containing protein